MEKEDLALANHLSGKTKTYLQLRFANTRDLMEVRISRVSPVYLPLISRDLIEVWSGTRTTEDACSPHRPTVSTPAAIVRQVRRFVLS